jgi:hypothetical protein
LTGSRWGFRPRLLAVLPVLAGPAQAQFFQRLFNPEVRVTLTHPPGLGLKVERVAFLPVPDPRSEELVAALVSDLAATGQVELVDRGNLDRIIQEQKFTNSGLVESATAVELGRLLGSPVLLVVKVHTFSSHQQPLAQGFTYKDKDGQEQEAVRYTARTQVELSGSVQAVDSATGRIFSARRLVANPSLENTSLLGQPAFPPVSEVRDLALKQVCPEVRRMLLSWQETRKLIFYDDKDYGMKDAYFRLQAEDYRGALARALEARDRARADRKAKTKHLSRTNYNLGMCHFILGDCGAALPCLQAAYDLEPGHGIFRESLRECQRALKLQEDLARVATRAPEGQRAQGLEERLERLERLKEKGLVTPEEYQKRRAELLKEI